MLVSTHIKNPSFDFNNKTMNDYIKQSNNNYMKLMFKCNEERKIKNKCGLDSSQLPPPPSRKELIISTTSPEYNFP